MQGVYLPRQLACRLIELEVGIQQENGLNRDSILQLIEIYTNAVEFYNEKGDDRRVLYYKRKMQDFLQQPAITQILQQGKKSQLTLRKQKNQEEVRRMSNQSQTLAKRLMEHSLEESHKQQQVIRLNLAKQEQTLQERIQRKRANSNRNPRVKLNSASFTCNSSRKDHDDKQLMLGSFVDLPYPSRK